jgi:hypothetical protein
MGTGAVSTSLILDERSPLADPLLWFGLTTWVALAALLAAAAILDRRRVRLEARNVAALSWPAATFMLGTHFTLRGTTWAGFAMLAVGACFWAVMLPPDVGPIRPGAPGAAFLGASATFTFAVLCNVLAAAESAEWLMVTALALTALGLGLYGYALVRFDFRQALSGLGDHWIPAGALATASFACGELRRTAHELGLLGDADFPLEVLNLVLWHLAMLWLPALIVCELIRPRLGFDARRWGTVYALGMFAASSLVVGSVEDMSWITDFGRAWVWVALTAWAVVLVATLAGIVAFIRAPGPEQPRAAR